MDILTELIDTLRLRGTAYCRTELTAPWGMLLPASDLAHFHVVQHGNCWVQIDGETSATPLTAGDLVVISHGRGHRLLDNPASAAIPLDDLIRGHEGGVRPLIRHGGGGAMTAFICGAFHFERRDDHPLLRILPGLVRVEGHDRQTPPWLESTLRFLADELRQNAPGSETIVARLIDIIFVQTIRAWIAQMPATDGGWLRALSDPQIGQALGLMHRAPERSWTVASLAAEVAMSRSAFSARFTQLTGEAPMTHLFRWRMWLAADQLRRDDLPIADIAARTGYESEMAFSKAFKRHFGVPPSVYRRQARQAA
jgi:AraC-like DNA-binding protein